MKKILSNNSVKHFDYKDTEMLKKFLDPYARVMSSKKTGTSAKNQRKLSLAIKRARFMGLLPFVGK